MFTKIALGRKTILEKFIYNSLTIYPSIWSLSPQNYAIYLPRHFIIYYLHATSHLDFILSAFAEAIFEKREKKCASRFPLPYFYTGVKHIWLENIYSKRSLHFYTTTAPWKKSINKTPTLRMKENLNLVHEWYSSSLTFSLNVIHLRQNTPNIWARSISIPLWTATAFYFNFFF